MATYDPEEESTVANILADMGDDANEFYYAGAEIENENAAFLAMVEGVDLDNAGSEDEDASGNVDLETAVLSAVDVVEHESEDLESDKDIPYDSTGLNDIHAMQAEVAHHNEQIAVLEQRIRERTMTMTGHPILMGLPMMDSVPGLQREESFDSNVDDRFDMRSLVQTSPFFQVSSGSSVPPLVPPLGQPFGLDHAFASPAMVFSPPQLQPENSGHPGHFGSKTPLRTMFGKLTRHLRVGEQLAKKKGEECGICQDFVQHFDMVKCEIHEDSCVEKVCKDCVLVCPYCDKQCCPSCWFETDSDNMDEQSCCLVCAQDGMRF